MTICDKKKNVVLSFKKTHMVSVSLTSHLTSNDRNSLLFVIWVSD